MFFIEFGLGGPGHRPIIESGSVGQKQHLHSLQQLTTTSPSLPLSCHNTIKGTVRFGGREHPLGSLQHGLTSKWKPTRSSTDTCTHPDRQTEPCVDPAARLWFADFVLRWTICWCITCLPTVFFFSQTASWPYFYNLLVPLRHATLLPLFLSAWALLLLILLFGPHHCVQLWPSQGAHAGAHLTGPWPQDDSQQQHVPYMRDKATQVSCVYRLFLKVRRNFQPVASFQCCHMSFL